MIKINRLLTPQKIGRLSILNCLIAIADYTGTCDENGHTTEYNRDYYEEIAKGGWGLIITEEIAVNQFGRGGKYAPGLWDNGQTAGQAKLCELIHQYDAKIFARLSHAGSQTDPDTITGRMPIAPSRLISTGTGLPPRDMTSAEVKNMASSFGGAALRAKQAGFNGVIIEGSSGSLVHEFLSCFTNKRTDEYGGEIINRCRFALEIIADIKEKCGMEFPVGISLSVEEVPFGLSLREFQNVALILENGGIDIISMSMEMDIDYPTDFWRAMDIPSYCVSAVKKVVCIPVIQRERISNPLQWELSLKAENCDFIGMTLAAAPDLNLPIKIAEERLEDIIPCARLSIKRQGGIAMQTAKKKSVLVIGGGPGGMEAAITSAGQGHGTTLIERDNQLGGRLRLAAAAPGNEEYCAFIVWQQTQLRKLGVKLFMDTEATAGLIDALEPEVVIVATGSKMCGASFPGTGKPHVFTATQVLEGVRLPGNKGVVIGGGIVGAESAYHILQHSKAMVTLVEKRPDILSEFSENQKSYMLRKLREAGISVMTGASAVEILDDGILVSQNGLKVKIDADFIVLSTGTQSNGRLAKDLEGRGYNVHTIGDAAEVRCAREAIREGHEVIFKL